MQHLGAKQGNTANPRAKAKSATEAVPGAGLGQKHGTGNTGRFRRKVSEPGARGEEVRLGAGAEPEAGAEQVAMAGLEAGAGKIEKWVFN